MDNPISRLLRGGEKTTGPDTEIVAEEPEEIEEEEEAEEEVVEPAYDLTRDNKVKFEETLTIDAEDEGDFATITVETIADSITFDVRIAGYTSRFGDVDVEYITGGGYAINLYHPKPDEDEYFVRRLYYYGDENGIGGEQHRDNSSEPMNTVWERDSDFGTTVEKQFSSTYLTIYDWRENMLTSGKPNPKDGEVVVRYKDSLRAGGGREEVDNVFNAIEANGVIDGTYTVQFISVDAHTGSYVLHSEREDEQNCLIYVPLDEISSFGNCDLKEIDELENPFDVSNVIWTRDPEQTWAIEGFNPENAEVPPEQS